MRSLVEKLKLVLFKIKRKLISLRKGEIDTMEESLIPGVRFFYGDDSEESREAEQLLKNYRLVYFPMYYNKPVKEDTRDEPKPPTLITGHYRAQGIQAIKRWVEFEIKNPSIWGGK